MRSPEPEVAREAARKVIELARMLAYRYATGEGAPQSTLRATLYWDEACSLGDAESCGSLRRAVPR